MAKSSGYSGTPLAKKLGIKSADRCFISEKETDYRKRFESLPEEITFHQSIRSSIDFAHIFVTSHDQLSQFLIRLRTRITPSGMIWVSWPKKVAKIQTDVTEDVIREIALPLGLVDIKVCAVDAVWSGLKLVIRVELREISKK